MNVYMSIFGRDFSRYMAAYGAHTRTYTTHTHTTHTHNYKHMQSCWPFFLSAKQLITPFAAILA